MADRLLPDGLHDFSTGEQLASGGVYRLPAAAARLRTCVRLALWQLLRRMVYLADDNRCGRGDGGRRSGTKLLNPHHMQQVSNRRGIQYEDDDSTAFASHV